MSNSEVNNEEAPLHRASSPASAPASGSGGTRRRHTCSSDSASASSDSSDHQVKRKRQGESDFDIQNLMYRVNALTNILLQNSCLPSFQTEEIQNMPSNCTAAHTVAINAPAAASTDTIRDPPSRPTTMVSSDFSLRRPTAAVPNETRLLNLGQVNTTSKDPKVPRADPEHLKRLELLQKFGDPSWKEVRYTDALKIHCATPGFVELDINDELRQFQKGKDYSAKSEKIVAAICNGLLTQRDLLNQSLQQLVDWAAAPDTTLSAGNIFDKISELFQPNSKFHKVSEEIMQIVCGKRAECIETRRERILGELPNKNLREGLRKIPPSSAYLFNETHLHAYIANTGGMDKWVRPWFDSGKELHKPNTKPCYKHSKPGPSREASQSFRNQEHASNSRKNKNFTYRPEQKRSKKVYHRKDSLPGKKKFDK
ncbi:uncharacterized protein LOC131852893 [Achroia grisella]|uniref:uncharacterized protein LOC131852893 n=1 Tax=Achroia grisella TaxID=688607 RepID=UPI0027D31383|nr:uncharacterized protein LOC131852893 [Achroia grisella]